MRKKNFLFTLPLLLALAVLLHPPAGLCAGKTIGLADIDGTWRINIDKSRASVKTASALLAQFQGVGFTVSAKDKTIRMEWPDFDPKTHKVTVLKADAKEVHCKLDGFELPMIIETSAPDEIFVKDRDETLVFDRVKK